MGAWIEILKSRVEVTVEDVAPHVGAWIEIPHKQFRFQNINVAPHVGAWIEILNVRVTKTILLSHPTWVRGLKLSIKSLVIRHSGRTPRGCVD